MIDDPVLEARNLQYHYDGAICALQGLDLRIHRGRRLVVLGANGAGKTTMFLHLNGTLRPEHGAVFIEGRKAGYGRRDLLAWRQQVGLVFQNPDDQLFAPTVEQDISFGPMNLGLPVEEVRGRVAYALRALRLESLRNRPTHSLSFGQKKRVAIAGAAAMQPKVLILDEPSAGLDPRGVDEMLDALDNLRQSGTTLVMATHDINLACEWADDVAVLQAGRILAAGTAERILADSKILESAGLSIPFVLEMGMRLQAMGLLSTLQPLPRSRAALLSALPVRSSIAAAASRKEFFTNELQ